MTFDVVKWGEFAPSFKWRQGEHLTVVKPTGGGKTTLLSKLLPHQSYLPTVVLISKVHDDTFTKYFPLPWRRYESWDEIPRHVDQVLLWPKFRGIDNMRQIQVIQREVFRHALNRAFRERGWRIVIDEEHYLTKTLGLGPEIEMLMNQGRSSGITVVNGIQRPAWVPLATFSNTTHAFIGSTTNRDDIKRLSDLGGINAKDLEAEAKTLEFYEFLYVPSRDPKKVPVRTTVEL